MGMQITPYTTRPLEGADGHSRGQAQDYKSSHSEDITAAFNSRQLFARACLQAHRRRLFAGLCTGACVQVPRCFSITSYVDLFVQTYSSLAISYSQNWAWLIILRE